MKTSTTDRPAHAAHVSDEPPPYVQEIIGLRSEIARLKVELEKKGAQAADLRIGVDHWKENYKLGLESADRLIKSCERSRDTHGVNFHQGIRAALVSSDIALTPLRDLLESTDLGKATLERVKELELKIAVLEGRVIEKEV